MESEIPPPREEAWALLATGLHVHRWFLHVQPYLDERERELVDRWSAGAGPAGRAALAELRGRLPQAAVEHLVDPCQPPGWWARGPLRPAVASLCGRPVVVVDAGAAHRVAPGRMVVSAGALLHGPPACDQPSLDAAAALLEAADLAQVVQLGVQLIVVGDEAAAAGQAPRTAVVAAAQPPDRLAEQLLSEAARTWVRLFLHRAVSRPDPERRWPSPLTGRPTGGEELAVEGYALCLRHQLLTRLAAPGERLAEVEAQVARLEAVVHDLAAWLGRIPISDLLTLTCPGPRRFEKYRRGRVAGQA